MPLLRSFSTSKVRKLEPLLERVSMVVINFFPPILNLIMKFSLVNSVSFLRSENQFGKNKYKPIGFSSTTTVGSTGSDLDF